MEEIALIQIDIASKLKDKYPDLDIVQDCNDNKFIHIDEAKALVNPTQYEVMLFPQWYIGSPRPKKRE